MYYFIQICCNIMSCHLGFNDLKTEDQRGLQMCQYSHNKWSDLRIETSFSGCIVFNIDRHLCLINYYADLRKAENEQRSLCPTNERQMLHNNCSALSQALCYQSHFTQTLSWLKRTFCYK